VALRSKDLADWSMTRQADKTGDEGAPPVQHL
jgi:hypothetical protein